MAIETDDSNPFCAHDRIEVSVYRGGRRIMQGTALFGSPEGVSLSDTLVTVAQQVEKAISDDAAALHGCGNGGAIGSEVGGAVDAALRDVAIRGNTERLPADPFALMATDPRAEALLRDYGAGVPIPMPAEDADAAAHFEKVLRDYGNGSKSGVVGHLADPKGAARWLAELLRRNREGTAGVEDGLAAEAQHLDREGPHDGPVHKL